MEVRYICYFLWNTPAWNNDVILSELFRAMKNQPVISNLRFYAKYFFQIVYLKKIMLALYHFVFVKMSHMLNCWKLQVCLSIYGLLVDIRR